MYPFICSFPQLDDELPKDVGGGVLFISVFTETSTSLGTQWVIKMSAERRDVTSRTEWGVNKITAQRHSGPSRWSIN